MTSHFQVCVLGSGSKGNCTYIKAGDVAILVDAGLPYGEIERRLSEISVSAASIQHLFVTHEHSDHVAGLRKFAKKHSVHIHMNAPTYLQIRGLLPRTFSVNLFDSTFEIDDITIHPFSISHDAADPVGFTFRYQNKKICVATDMGYVTKLVLEELKNSDVVILESNHDEAKLMNGRYPWPLKQRIASHVGHLSNRQAAEALCAVVHEGLQCIFLAHLSEENNSPAMALDCVGYYLSETVSVPPALLMTHQHRPSEVIHL